MPRAFCNGQCEGYANCTGALAQPFASPCLTTPPPGRGLGTGLGVELGGGASRILTPRPAQHTKAGFHRCNPPVAVDLEARTQTRIGCTEDPRPRHFFRSIPFERPIQTVLDSRRMTLLGQPAIKPLPRKI